MLKGQNLIELSSSYESCALALYLTDSWELLIGKETIKLKFYVDIMNLEPNMTCEEQEAISI